LIQTTTDLFACGLLASYVGGNDWSQNGPFISVKSKWDAAGAMFPYKELVGNYNTLHIIDANDNMFASGSNVQGEIGNGTEYSHGEPGHQLHGYGISEIMNWLLAGSDTGKFKNICTSNTITWYLYAQDMEIIGIHGEGIKHFH